MCKEFLSSAIRSPDGKNYLSRKNFFCNGKMELMMSCRPKKMSSRTCFGISCYKSVTCHEMLKRVQHDTRTAGAKTV